MENKKFLIFFKKVIKEKHARVGFHKRLHIRWKILNSKFAPSRETNRLLKDVVGILNTRFDKILGYSIDDLTEKVPLIPLIVKGSVKGHANMHGMFTAILLVNQKVVSIHLSEYMGMRLINLLLSSLGSYCD
ncbi:increased DNA methylation [Trifolium repens]|nr:increased DNA methylation [Trifolium repens]